MIKNLPIELELRKLDLTEKEVKVYLAGLELGPSSVQKIAELVNIARPTTYEIIKRLEKKGLFEEVKEKRKRLFSARSPENILGLLRTKKREIEEKEREFIRIISALEPKYSKEGIKVFKGKEGLRALGEIISFSRVPEIIIVNRENNPINYKRIYRDIKKRLGEVKVKEINSGLDGTLIIFDRVAYFPKKKQIGFLLG
ncbi:MAG: helix-turn-helix domain-containing protein [bacterium]|nr:helix-turn-helix domain-containing protein [bacterium]